MEWIADNILWLLGLAWLASLVLVARSLLGLWRRLRPAQERSRSWLRIIGLLVMLAVGAGGLMVASSGLRAMGPGLLEQRRMIGEPAPALTWTRLADGASANLTDHRGAVVLVNQWATWCPPCREEMPDLDRLQMAYRDRGLVIVHLSDEDADTVRGYLANRSMTTEHGLADPLPWPDTGRPTTFVIDREGIVRRAVLGGRSYEQFEALISPWL